MSEEFRPVVGYEGAYLVSDHGRVVSMQRTIQTKTGERTIPEKTLKLSDSNGYCLVRLAGGDKLRTVLVHTLVLESFVGLKPPGKVARHLNGVRNDNRKENLSWGTYSENNRDTVDHGNHNFAKRSECSSGHNYKEVGYEISSTGSRRCKECRRSYRRKWYTNRKNK